MGYFLRMRTSEIRRSQGLGVYGCGKQKTNHSTFFVFSAIKLVSLASNKSEFVGICHLQLKNDPHFPIVSQNKIRHDPIAGLTTNNQFRN